MAASFFVSWGLSSFGIHYIIMYTGASYGAPHPTGMRSIPVHLLTVLYTVGFRSCMQRQYHIVYLVLPFRTVFRVVYIGS